MSKRTEERRPTCSTRLNSRSLGTRTQGPRGPNLTWPGNDNEAALVPSPNSTWPGMPGRPIKTLWWKARVKTLCDRPLYCWSHRGPGACKTWVFEASSISHRWQKQWRLQRRGLTNPGGETKLKLSVYDMNHECALRIKNRSERDLRS